MGQDANAVREKQSMKPTGHQDILVHNPDFLTSKISGDGFLIQRFFNPVSLASWRIRIGRPGARLRSGLSEGVRRHVDRCRSLAGSRDHSVASEGGAKAWPIRGGWTLRGVRDLAEFDSGEKERGDFAQFCGEYSKADSFSATSEEKGGRKNWDEHETTTTNDTPQERAK